MNRMLSRDIICDFANYATVQDEDKLYEIGIDDMDIPALEYKIGVWGLDPEMTVKETIDLAASAKQNEKEKEQ